MPKTARWKKKITEWPSACGRPRRRTSGASATQFAHTRSVEHDRSHWPVALIARPQASRET